MGEYSSTGIKNVNYVFGESKYAIGKFAMLYKQENFNDTFTKCEITVGEALKKFKEIFLSLKNVDTLLAEEIRNFISINGKLLKVFNKDEIIYTEFSNFYFCPKEYHKEIELGLKKEVDKMPEYLRQVKDKTLRVPTRRTDYEELRQEKQMELFLQQGIKNTLNGELIHHG